MRQVPSYRPLQPPHIPSVILRRSLLALPALAALPARAQPRARYVFDHSAGRIGFSARHLGLFSSDGQFDRFQATLWMDPANPATAAVECVVETGQVSIPFPGATDLLRSAPYFDIAQFPTARFEGEGRGTMAGNSFAILGQLTVRGITRPFRMTGQLVERRAEGGRDWVSFRAEGEMRRGEFGMVADRTLISDAIRLSVAVRIAV